MSDGGRIIPGLDRIVASRIASWYERISYHSLGWFVGGINAFGVAFYIKDRNPALGWVTGVVAAFFLGAIVASEISARSVRPPRAPDATDE